MYHTIFELDILPMGVKQGSTHMSDTAIGTLNSTYDY